MRFITAIALLATAAISQAQVPPPSSEPIPKGSYTLDKAHTSLIFRVDHLGFSTFTARFTRYDAKLDFDPTKLGASSVDVTIDPRSISSDNAPDGFLDTLAAGKDWLDASEYPEMKFVSRGVESPSDGTLLVRGDLTVRGITKPIVLNARFNGGYAGHPFDPAARIGFSAEGSFKRSDFGVAFGIPAPGTTFGVSDEVKVTLEAEFTGPPLKVAKR
ncbi:MAG TPA: YceI family protein [Steroidobacteraceae bacterium]|nr:YceI family protein [Steroidobacteraceae bacterium]